MVCLSAFMVVREKMKQSREEHGLVAMSLVEENFLGGDQKCKWSNGILDALLKMGSIRASLE